MPIALPKSHADVYTLKNQFISWMIVDKQSNHNGCNKSEYNQKRNEGHVILQTAIIILF